MTAFYAAYNRHVTSTGESIKFNYHTNKDNVSGSRKPTLADVRSRTVTVSHGGNIDNLRFPKSNIIDTIDDVLQHILRLMGISLQINHYYGRQILFSLVAGLICITVQFYFLIIHLRFGFVGVEQVWAFCSCILILLHVIEFGSILVAGEKVKKEVRSSAVFDLETII